MQTIRLSLFLFSILTGISGSSPEMSTYSGANNLINLIEIPQKAPFNSCKVLTTSTATYVCNQQIYMTQEIIPTKADSSTQTMTDIVIDAHTDNQTIVIAKQHRLVAITNRTFVASISLGKDIPVITRVKVQPEYVRLATIIKSFPMLENSSEKFRANNSAIQMVNTPNDHTKYSILTSLLGVSQTTYQIPLPQNVLSFQLHDYCFKDLAIYHDALFGNDYVLVALEGGRLLFFKSAYQSARLEFIKVQNLGESYEILNMEVHDSYMFILLLTNQTNTEVRIYRVNTDNELSLREECALSFDQVAKSEGDTQLKVKSIEDQFILTLNFPGQKLITYHFNKPISGLFKLECQISFNTLDYKDIVKEVSIGYSFDYAFQPTSNNLANQGYLLSPITPGSQSSYFIPYCFPKFYSNMKRLCVPYINDTSASESFDSQHLVNKQIPLDTILTISDIIANNNQSSSLENTRALCSEHMSLLGATLPDQGYWELNSQGQCQLRCKVGFPDEVMGTCLNDKDFQLKKNNCAQLNDCLNCSFSQTCSWSQGACQSNPKEDLVRSKQAKFLDDILKPALTCGSSRSCGQAMYTESSGTISFSEDSVYNNHLCSWKIQSSDSKNVEIELQFITEELSVKSLRNLPEVYFQYWDYASSLKRQVSLKTLLLNEGKTVAKVPSKEVTIYVIVQESFRGDAQKFKINYEVKHIMNPLEIISGLFKWTYFAVFILLVCSCTLSSVRNIIKNYYRGRFLNDIHALDENTEQDLSNDHHIINIQNIIKYQSLVSKAAKDDGRQIEYNQTECSICLENFGSSESLVEFGCKHVLHLKCFERWVTSANSDTYSKCPICKTDIT